MCTCVRIHKDELVIGGQDKWPLVICAASFELKVVNYWVLINLTVALRTLLNGVEIKVFKKGKNKYNQKIKCEYRYRKMNRREKKMEGYVLGDCCYRLTHSRQDVITEQTERSADNFHQQDLRGLGTISISSSLDSSSFLFIYQLLLLYFFFIISYQV